MFVLKNGKIGAMLSAVAILIGAGLLSLPAVSFAGPEEVTRVGLKNVPLAAGTVHSLAVASDGTVWHWGLAIDRWGPPLVGILQPTRMDFVDGVVATAGGDEINLALKSDGTVWSIGHPRVGQVAGLSEVVAVDAGKDYGLALKSDGTVWQVDLALKPIQVSGLAEIVAVAVGAYYYGPPYYEGDSPYHATALKKDGTVWTWTDPNNATIMKELMDVVAIAAGFDHHLALKSDGTVWAWGSNTCGQTGGSIRTSWAGGSPDYSARKVEGIGNVTAISAGGGYHFFTFGHSLALKSDGTVWQWGCDGTAIFNPTPRQVAGLTGGLAIAAGGEHSLVLKKDGTVWGWGWNYYGQLGNGTRASTYFEDGIVSTLIRVVGLPPLIIIYLNEHGQPYNNEEYSYWYNEGEQQWYRGSKGGRITPIASPPWEEQNAP